MKQKMGIACVLAAGILWGILGIFVREFNAEGLQSLQITFIRVTFSSLCLIVGLFLYDRKLLKIQLRDCWCFIGPGIIGFTFFNYGYFTTMQYTSLSIAAVLLYTAPVFVMTFSIFLFKEQLTKHKIAAFVLAFGGCTCSVGLFGSEHAISWQGILLGLGSGLGYGLVTVFTRYALQRGYHSLTIVLYTMIFASIGTAVAADIGPVFQVLAAEPLLIPHGFLFAVLCTILPNLFYTLGLERLENGKASIIASIEPIAATVTGVIAFHELFDIWGALGIALMIAALIVLNRNQGQL